MSWQTDCKEVDAFWTFLTSQQIVFYGLCGLCPRVYSSEFVFTYLCLTVKVVENFVSW